MGRRRADPVVYVHRRLRRGVGADHGRRLQVAAQPRHRGDGVWSNRRSSSIVVVATVVVVAAVVVVATLPTFLLFFCCISCLRVCLCALFCTLHEKKPNSAP